MEAMADLPADVAADDYDEEPEEESDKMQAALAQNAALKEMLAQMEEQERLARAQQEHRSPHAARGHASQSRHGRGAPPGHAKNGGWGGMTHTEHRSHQIDRDNQILVAKLSNIAIKPTMNTRANAPFRVDQNRSSVSINRRRQDDKVARENAALAKRLNSVKATTTLSNKTAKQHAKKHDGLVRMLGNNPLATPSGQLLPSRARSAAQRTAVLPSVREPFT